MRGAELKKAVEYERKCSPILAHSCRWSWIQRRKKVILQSKLHS